MSGALSSSVFDELVGQHAVVDQLREAVAGQGMTHAWLFTGPPGSGRSVAARAFAAALQCRTGGCGHCEDCHQVLAGTHADVAVVVPEGFDANDVIKIAYGRYDLSLGGGLNKVAGKVFRIGHLGWLNEIMVLQALGGVELAMRDVGIPFEPGVGVGAAVRHLSRADEAMRVAAE